MLKSNLTEQDLKIKIEAFLQAHPDYYSEEEKKYIRECAAWGLYTDFSDALLRQIYAELDLMPDEHNIYLGFISLISNIYGLDKNIVEVGGGKIPSLAKYIALKQQTGTITVYDPSLVVTTTPHPNLILKKASFSKNLPELNPDLIIGFMPTSATEEMLEYAYQTKTNFLIALSDMTDAFDVYEQDEIWTHWQQEIIYSASRKAEENGLGKLKILTLDKYDNPYPIIYTNKKY